MARSLACFLLVCCALSALLPEAALAQRSGNPLIRQGAELHEELRFEEALQVLSAALIRAGNSDEDRVTIYRILALTYLSLAREEEAAGAYRSLLAISPEHVMGSEISPRMRAFFEQVRERWESEGRPGLAEAPAEVEIRHRSPAQAERLQPIRLSANVEDPSGAVARLVLAYRQGTSDVFRRIECQLEGAAHIALIPAEDVRAPLVEYYFEALDEAGLPIASRGDVAAPLRVAVPAPSSGSILSKWWFWTAAAVVVAGAVTATVLLVGEDGAPAQGTLLIDVR